MSIPIDSLTTLNESYMLDTCTIQRDPQEESDDTWDDNVGEYVPPAGDLDEIYNGVCMVYPNTAFTERQRGDVPENVTQYWLEIPKTADPVKPDDIVTVTASLHDPRLVNKVFILDTEETDTYATSRRIRMHDRQAQPT